MTFKNLFNKLEFEITLEADFCVVLQKMDTQYVIYDDGEIKCISLYNFQEQDIDTLSYLYDINSFGMPEENDEYEFQHSITREQIISFLFGVETLDEKLVGNYREIKDFFGEDLFYHRRDEKLAIYLSDKNNKTVNLLTFDDTSYDNVFVNTNGCWIKAKEEEEVIIGWDPYYIFNYCLNKKVDKSAVFIMPIRASFQTLRRPLEYAFKTHTLLCNDRKERGDALRLITAYMVLNGIDNIEFREYGNNGEIEIIMDDEKEILPYVQMSARCMKKLRTTYLSSDQEVKTFSTKKINAHGKRVFIISFNLNIPELEVLTDCLIEEYKLPFEVYS